MTTTSLTVPAVPDLVFTDPERLALAGFLAGYRGLTRDAYALDLRQFVAWCERHGLKLCSVRRTDIELHARALEEAGSKSFQREDEMAAAVDGRRRTKRPGRIGRASAGAVALAAALLFQLSAPLAGSTPRHWRPEDFAAP
jgi:hypothetical protein